MFNNSTFICKAKTSLLLASFMLAGVWLGGNASAQHCTPTMQSKCCNMGNKNVTFGNSINYTIASYNTAKVYYDEYSNVSACVTAGSQQPMAVTVQSGNYPQAVCVWIDWNTNNTFDAGEIQMDTTSIPQGSTFSDTIDIPSGQSSGNYRMRVLVDYYYYYTNQNQSFNPCQGYYYGDFVDFKITVVGTSGLDVGLDKVLQPSVLTIGNNNTVQIGYKNLAGTTIDSLRAGYSFNGGSPVIEKITKNAVGNTLALPTCEKESYTFNQKITIANAGNYTLKVWVSHPNGTAPDDNKNNDTLVVTACTALSGTYTIDGSSGSSGTNYTNFTDAVNALNQCGIAGPVKFNVATATYTEKVSIGSISGSSATNTITFKGKDSTCELTNSAGTTFELDGADYVNVRNMMISSSATTNGGPVKLTNHADHNSFDSVWMVATSTNYPVVCFGVMGDNYYTYGEYGDYNSVTNCYLEGGYINCIFNGDYNVKGVGNKITNSTIFNCAQYLMFNQYQDSFQITDNIIDAGSAQWSYAIYLAVCTEVDLMRNEISAGYMGVYAYNNDYLDIVNNSMVCAGYYSFYNYYNDNVNVWHNSILNTNSGVTAYAWYQYQGTAHDVRNNIFAVNGTTSYAFYSQNPAPFTVMEANIYSALNSTNYVYMATAFANKAALKGANSLNNIMYDQFPNWVSSSAPYNLHLTSTVQALSGDGTTGVTDDVDGDARCTFAPSIGSDESKFPLPAPVSNFTIPDTAYLNSPFNCLNSAGANDGKAFDWFLDGSAVSYSTNRNIFVSFASTGVHCVKLETKNCTATHDTTKCVFITTPPTKPAADFIADKNTVEPSDEVSFTDLSTVGPTTWDWSITPGTLGVEWDYTQGTSSSSQHPFVTFYTPGNYDICLVSSNSQGYDTVCKSKYIEVLSVDMMCQNAVSYSPKNNFYDDGGKGGNYSLNQTCTFLIDPCASTVTLDFTKFAVNNNVAFLRIFDGSSNKGKAFHSGNGFTGTSSIGPFTALSGKIYMEWRSGNWGAQSGWEAQWTSTSGNMSAPSSAYITNKTGWVGGVHSFTAKNYDANTSYEWTDCQGNSYGSGASFSYSFQANGQYTVCLTATNCAGTTTTTDTVVVYAPTAAPTADFMANVSSNTNQCNVAASNTINIQFGDTVKLLDLSNQGASSWAWDATPSGNVVWIDAVTDQNPRVTFNKLGTYTVMLDATNGIGTGSITKTNFIRVLAPYCTPAISQTVSDIGITRVKVATIDNATSVNLADGFTNYSRSFSSCVDRGAKYPITVERSSNQNPINRKVWVDWNHDGDYTDAGETVAAQASTMSLSWTDTLKVPATATLGATRIRVGVSFGGNSNISCGPNNFGEFEEYGLFITEDLTPPVITLLGKSTVSIEQCQTYTEAGATAFDAVDGVVSATLSSNTVNMAVLGTYYVTYIAVDAAGNQAVPAIRTVIVTADNIGPVITLNGSNPMNVDVNTSYTEPGASAVDACSGQLPASSLTITGSLNTAVLGTYTLNYDANDPAGNPGVTVSRKVVVGVFTPPTITLTGTNPLTWPVGTAFVDPGASASSTYYTAGLTVTSDAATAVNAYLLGTYTVTYSCTDPSGNTGTTTRTVNVTDAVPPTINVIGGETLTVEAKASGTWTDLGAYAMDNYYPSITVTPSGSVDLSVLSTVANPYQMITYTATDGSGNTTNKTRYVEVKKTTKPVINLTSTKVVHTLRWRTYTDAGASTTDTYYSSLQLNSLLTKTNNVDVQNPGVYTYVYHLTDPSGNTADDATRIVIVDENVGISGVDLEKDVTLFPNPTTGVFNITMSADAKDISIKVMNALGQTVKVVEANKVNGTNFSVDMTGHASGMYFVAITNGDNITVKKLKLLGN